MKRLVILLILMIALTSFISAQQYPCDPDDNDSIQGGYIDGNCYDCSDEYEDGVCPEDYGADCKGISDLDCAQTPQAFWSLTYGGTTAKDKVVVDGTVTGGKKVYLNLKNSGLSDGATTFDIYEPRLVFNNYFKDITATVSNGNAIANWTITSSGLEDIDYVNNKIYFRVGGQSSGGLIITVSYESQITLCSNYNSNTTCIADNLNVGDDGVIDRVDGSCIYTRIGYCSWNGKNCMRTINETSSVAGCDQARGSCSYPTEVKNGDCISGDFFTVTYSSPTSGCEPWTTGFIACPAQLKLPFFGFFNIIASISIISIIYAFLIYKKRYQESL